MQLIITTPLFSNPILDKYAKIPATNAIVAANISGKTLVFLLTIKILS